MSIVIGYQYCLLTIPIMYRDTILTKTKCIVFIALGSYYMAVYSNYIVNDRCNNISEVDELWSHVESCSFYSALEHWYTIALVFRRIRKKLQQQ